MSLFTSTQEKRFWLLALLVATTILSTLFIGQPLRRLLSSQDLQAVIFLGGMLTLALAVVLQGWQSKPHVLEIIIWLSLIAVCGMFFLRLGLPERSHLIEYSALSIFILNALQERSKQRQLLVSPYLATFLLAFPLGLFDEILQGLIPNRVFDPNDILFNALAIGMTIGVISLLRWVKHKLRTEA
ncbi:MAG: VanZ family protein [Saprospiraceae bacterium]|nr:VanZ family protein [Saprospiraceae bacterium]